MLLREPDPEKDTGLGDASRVPTVIALRRGRRIY